MVQPDRDPDRDPGARQTIAPERRPPPGQAGLALLGLAVGVTLISIQLWLLTLAFDLYKFDEDTDAILAAAFSGLVFFGGLAMLHILDRRPRRRG
ncbi:MAG TPA: hypothetical protein VFV93_14170 [Thermomicrobiales bacterium]|nr:hypothetical protein [Thermomicrobiales bacterium]